MLCVIRAHALTIIFGLYQAGRLASLASLCTYLSAQCADRMFDLRRPLFVSIACAMAGVHRDPLYLASTYNGLLLFPGMGHSWDIPSRPAY